MDTDASIVDSFLSVAEAKLEDKIRIRRATLQKTHGKAFEDYERELLPVVEAIAALADRSGSIVNVVEPENDIGFAITLLHETAEGPASARFTYSFIGARNPNCPHKIDLYHESKAGSGSYGGYNPPKTFADVRTQLADWLVQKMPDRVKELRAIARSMTDDDDMELDRSIKTGGTIKLKTVGQGS